MWEWESCSCESGDWVTVFSPTLPLLEMERVVDWSSEAGVGEGVPRGLEREDDTSCRARDGGRGSGIRLFAIFSRWTLLGRGAVEEPEPGNQGIKEKVLEKRIATSLLYPNFN